MAKKLKMNIWSTVPAISENTKELQAKINELIDEIDMLKSALENISKDNSNCNLPQVIEHGGSVCRIFNHCNKVEKSTYRCQNLRIGSNSCYEAN